MSPNNQSYRPPPIGSVIGDGFRVLRFVGAGAMGSVYEVSDDRDRRFAAKILLHPALIAQGIQLAARFEREARVTAAIENDHVVRVHHAGVEPSIGVPFYVMDLLRGYDLETLVERIGPLHPVTAARVICQACDGLRAAHQAGAIHRDIKPSNIFLHQTDDNRIVVKVCDFGIAKWTSEQENITASGSVLGTPLYMAPEQALSSKSVDERADVWSLGMSLYHALAGTPAYERVGRYASLLLEIVKGEVPRLQNAAPWIEAHLAEIVHGALLKDREKRCPSPSEFARALANFAGGSTELSTELLQAAPREMQLQVAGRARVVTAWSTDVANTKIDAVEASLFTGHPDPLCGQWIAGRYQIDKLIGRGGMGSVYSAKTCDGSRVALKLVIGDGSSRHGELLRRFVREARVLTSIDSPYVVRVVDVDTDTERGLPFIAMELLDGNDLERFVRKWGPLEPEPIVRLFRDAAQGLAAAHAAGVVHRDVKPANIFLHELENSEVVPKIFDFGIAKSSVTGDASEGTMELTRTGGMIGSPLYMSPEQARNAKEVDERSDIWSLGLSLWEALSGQRPWEDCTTVGELVLAVCTKNVTPLQDLAPWVEPGLAEIVHRCLQRNAEDRYATMGELAKSLEKYASDDGPLTRASLIPVSAERRSSSARRAVLRGYDTPVPAISSLDHREEVEFRGSKKKQAVLWVSIGVVTIVAIGAWATIRGEESKASAGQEASQKVSLLAASPPSVAPSGGQSDSPKKLLAKLAIRPSDATVFVRGRPGKVVGGVLVLEGMPGESFLVTVHTDAGTTETNVVITTDGQTMPSGIEQARPKASVSAGKKAAITGSPSKVPAEVPPASTTGTVVRPVETW